MVRRRRRRSKKAGLPPGSLVHIGEQKLESVRITIHHYTPTTHEERTAGTLSECFPYRDKPGVTWINVDGLHDVKVIEQLGERFGLHPLLQEDIVNTDQRPKLDDLGTHLFVVLKMLDWDDERGEISIDQVSLVLGSNYVLSFQEEVGDVWEPVRDRLRSGAGRIRSQGPDYLAYRLLDAVVDQYFVIGEKFGERFEQLEEEVVGSPTPASLHSLHLLKREMIMLRRSIWPLREVMAGLTRMESPLIQRGTVVYLRDVYDHAIQVIDTIETERDLVAGLFDIYLSNISNRLNQVMKVLTIITTIFIPLSFVAGIYGMNFRHMPELEQPWAYPAVLLFMLVIALLMLYLFRRRHWL